MSNFGTCPHVQQVSVKLSFPFYQTRILRHFESTARKTNVIYSTKEGAQVYILLKHNMSTFTLKTEVEKLVSAGSSLLKRKTLVTSVTGTSHLTVPSRSPQQELQEPTGMFDFWSSPQQLKHSVLRALVYDHTRAVPHTELTCRWRTTAATR